MTRFYDYTGLKIIAGPCLLESYDHACEMVERISAIMDLNGCKWVYKTSFDKANRTSWESERTIGLDECFYVFYDLKNKYADLEILTDVHDPWQCDVVPVDIIQIPAFLCRQTDLLKAAAESGKPVNVKKGQFLSPKEMLHVVRKLEHFGCREILITERGSCFGYNNLIVDMRSLQIMKNFAEKYPVIIDCTHSVQAPGGLDGKTGGERRFAPTIAYAAYATGYCDGVFMEVHNDPDNAPSDGPNMIHIDDLNAIVSHLKKLHDINSPSTPEWEPPYTPEGPKTWEQLQVDYDRFDG